MIPEAVRHEADKIGLRPYSSLEILTKYRTLLERSTIGLKRDPPKNIDTDGGLLAIDTGIAPLTLEQWAEVPVGASALVGDFGGTNWHVGIVTKNPDGNAEYVDIYTKTITEKEKKLPVKGIVGLMAKHIKKALKKGEISEDKISAIGIAFGFAHKNIHTENGIDAELLPEAEAKGWDFPDVLELSEKERLIGEPLIKFLQEKGHFRNLQGICIKNDTNALADHTIVHNGYAKISGAMIAGTGDNGASGSINWEAGKAPDDVDSVSLKMASLGLLPKEYVDSGRTAIEYRMGGDFIRYRVIAALGLLGDQQLLQKETADLIFNKFKSPGNQNLISDIASGKMSLKKLRAFMKNRDIDQDTYDLLQEISHRALQQAGQMIGILASMIIENSGYKGGRAILPAQGGVIWKGYGVLDEVKKTIDALLPGNKVELIEGSGLIGIGQAALALAHKVEDR